MDFTLDKALNPKIQLLQKIPQYEQRSSEWFSQRRSMLTSSDAATALGINPYQKPEELLFKKCGDGKPFTSNVATLWGQKYEDEAVDHYCEVTGKKAFLFGLIPYADVERDAGNKYFEAGDFSWLGGSPDGVAEDIYDPSSEPILLEIKCPYKRKIKMGEIPDYYLPQVQLNMAICNVNKADFVEYRPSQRGEELTLNIVRINRDPQWFSDNVPVLREFWKTVLHYREVGLKAHPEYNTYHYREPKAITIEEENSSDGEKKRPYSFLEDN